MPSENDLFRAALALVGQEVIVELSSPALRAKGRITNAMFDSLLLEADGHRRVVPFAQIRTLMAASPPPAGA